jgi:hypothetical protein
MAEAVPATKIQNESRVTLTEGHVLRSSFLDAMAVLESHLAQLMNKLGLDAKLSASLGQRLTELAESKYASKIERIRPCLLEISSFRAKVAHSQLSIVQTETSEPMLCFSVVPIGSYQATIIPVAAFRQEERRVKQLANQLKQLAELPDPKRTQAPTSPAATSAKASAR